MRKNKTWLIITLVVIVLVAGLWYLNQTDRQFDPNSLIGAIVNSLNRLKGISWVKDGDFSYYNSSNRPAYPLNDADPAVLNVNYDPAVSPPAPGDYARQIQIAYQQLDATAEDQNLTLVTNYLALLKRQAPAYADQFEVRLVNNKPMIVKISKYNRPSSGIDPWANFWIIWLTDDKNGRPVYVSVSANEVRPTSADWSTFEVFSRRELQGDGLLANYLRKYPNRLRGN